jgi:hypothetical protein
MLEAGAFVGPRRLAVGGRRAHNQKPRGSRPLKTAPQPPRIRQLEHHNLALSYNLSRNVRSAGLVAAASGKASARPTDRP